MLLVHRSARAANAVRTMSPGEELFVASVVVCMILAAFGDAVDPAVLDAVGLEIFLMDFGGEFSLLAMSQWHLLQLLLAGGVLAAAITGLRMAGAAYVRSLHPAPTRAVDKVPIQL